MEPTPYPSHPDAAALTVGRIADEREEPRFIFTTQESLVAHFSHWFPADSIASLIEAEKQVFVVRRECSLAETRLQFLKKCENALIRCLQDPREAGGEDWSAVV